MSPATADHKSLGLPGPPASPLMYLAAGAHETGLWDLAAGQCHQV